MPIATPAPSPLNAVLFGLRGCLVLASVDATTPTPGALACLRQLRQQAVPCLWLDDRGDAPERQALLDSLPAWLPGHVVEGRPYPAPDACWQALISLGSPRLAGSVLVSGDPALLEAALNAGLWTVGLAACSPCCANSALRWQRMSGAEQAQARGQATLALFSLGVHSVIDHLEALHGCLQDIRQRMAKGEKP
ncbi:phosphonoacetaldehyde phosphohydrolase-related protein [Pseudomonas cremoricolorata]|uniref:Phosphonoacetaldehyde phosphonohydrolase-related protein n=1 Tax=Pseudomonas cremoricolorata TaxID=157783 RepID=A0A089WSX5_9PSED|nr:phosphonoacetaldehyde phosphohydrolase-related protein [Pseudomonas cremoricolorata]AIR90289.1 phosphonoacetaldehyde phosphonohydrolase-related protein [Pseudomonas cremoricolorata]